VKRGSCSFRSDAEVIRLDRLPSRMSRTLPHFRAGDALSLAHGGHCGRKVGFWKSAGSSGKPDLAAGGNLDETRFTSRVFTTGRDSCYNFAMAPKPRAEIELAQTLTHYPIAGELLTRTRYGDECFGWRSDMAPCHDCGVTKGQLHIPCCDVEECPNCHTQLLSCDCDIGDACSAD
jgi:hypothetical protein